MNTEHTPDKTCNIKRHIRKTAQNIIKAYPKEGPVAGHCYRAKDEIISSLMFWTPPGPNRSNRLTYPGVISRDTDLMIQDLPAAMADRAVWLGVK